MKTLISRLSVHSLFDAVAIMFHAQVFGLLCIPSRSSRPRGYLLRRAASPLCLTDYLGGMYSNVLEFLEQEELQPRAPAVLKNLIVTFTLT